MSDEKTPPPRAGLGDGGSVFGGDKVVHTPPSQYSPTGWAETKTTGLTVRDYFAGQALAGILANPTWNVLGLSMSGVTDNPFFEAAKMAYHYSQAMLIVKAAQPGGV